MENKQPSLTDEQRQALVNQAGKPLYIVDPNSHCEFVLIPADQYEQYQALFETDDFDISESYAAQHGAASRVWDDPELDQYNDA